MKIYIFLIYLFAFLQTVSGQSLSIDFAGETSSNGENAGSTKIYPCKITNRGLDTWVKVESGDIIISGISPSEAFIQQNKTATFNVTVVYPITAGSRLASFRINTKDSLDHNWSLYSSQTFWIVSKNITISPPSNLNVSNITGSSFRLTWTASTGGNGGIRGYYTYINNQRVGNVQNGTGYNFTGLSDNTTYEVYVEAYDYAFRTSQASTKVSVTTLCTIPSTITDNNNYGTTSASTIKQATNAIYLTNGFRYTPSGSGKYMAQIVSCPTPTRTARLIDPEVEDEYDVEATGEEAYEQPIAEPFIYGLGEQPNVDIALYPIPVKEILYVDLGNSYEDVNSIDIYSISGLRVQTVNISNHKHAIDLRDCSNGVYFVRVNYKNELIENLKFVISK